eukprot:NODE_3724_length_1995_cov_22.503212.p1 GENE.NODE_3724_length_1995_cov_22.503212~~NODE_3724_length_1995_cov_22.503212.p1  ORF type:complete len:395 (+),score=70.51 NODE_3724_length_1995_cov_22.503212:179-1363(+)
MDWRMLKRPVRFDIHEEQVSEATWRDVGSKSESPWMAIAQALQHVREQNLDVPEDWPAKVTEAEVRSRVVDFYRRQPPEVLPVIAREKLHDPTSYFCVAGYTEELEVAAHWSWHLFCLTYDVPADDNTAVQSHVVPMPLDTVDMRLVAEAFQVKITVTRPLEEAICVQPFSRPVACCIHLINHETLWAPLLGDRQVGKSSNNLVNAIVSLGELAGPLEPCSRRNGTVMCYHATENCYEVAVEQLHGTVRVERQQIMDILFRARDPSGPEKGAAKCDMDATWRADADWYDQWSIQFQRRGRLPGIPDQSVEYSLLHSLVIHTASKRLSQEHSELTGRAPVTNGSHTVLSGAVASGNAVPWMPRHEPLPQAGRTDARQQPSAASTATVAVRVVGLH